MSEPRDADLREAWNRLVAVAMLGTDRRNPPEPVGVIADLVDDTVRSTPSERMLAQVAATVAVRRAGVVPGPVRAFVAGPDVDERPTCVPAAVDRWHHVISSWPVLEDEWMLTLIVNGWRVPPELVPELLLRHRSDPVRRARAQLACGPLAAWLVDHLPELAPARPPANPVCVTLPVGGPTRIATQTPAFLPITPDLEPLLLADGALVAREVAGGIERGTAGSRSPNCADQPDRPDQPRSPRQGRGGVRGDRRHIDRISAGSGTRTTSPAPAGACSTNSAAERGGQQRSPS